MLQVRGKIILSDRTNKSNQYQIVYNSKKFRATIEKIKIEDQHLSSVWGDQLAKNSIKITG